MASVTALQCISRGSYGGALGTETTRTSHGSKIPSLKSQATAFEGLRTRNVVDSIRLRTDARATSRQSKRAPAVAGTGTYPVVICGKGMNIVFVGAEMAPWSKTGGLGDVLGGLPPYMAANGHRVMAIAPRYDQYYDGWDTSVVVDIKVGNKVEKVRFFHCHKRGVDRVFVDHPLFLEKVWGKTESMLYGPTPGVDYEDNQLRYSILCQAALIAPLALHLNNNPYYSGPYGDDVMFIANDWHTGPLASYMKSMYKSRGIYKNAKVVFCIHNIVYQGRFAESDYSLLNLPESFRPSFHFHDGYNKPVKGNKINWMKAGINESDRVATVSPYYAKELVSGEDRGVELHKDLTRTGVTGIVNGMDTIEWDPMTDKYLNCNYDARTVREARHLNKEALQAQVGLPVDRNIPLLAFLGRLEEQKGSDILAAAIPGFMDENCQVLVLGTGKKEMERQLAELEARYPNKVRTHFKFNVPLAHSVMAGADYLIITSRFEPCGLIQLQGMRYGLPSICSSTGGLVDTIREGFTGFHMGAFGVNCDRVDEREVQNVVSTVKRAIHFYRTPGYDQMIQNCMHQDLSWKGPAKRWEEFLLGLGAAGSEPGVEGEEIAPRAQENVANP